MKSRFLLAAALCLSLAASAQTDTTIKNMSTDTLHVGDMIIIKKGGDSDNNYHEFHLSHRHNYKPSNIINWNCLSGLELITIKQIIHLQAHSNLRRVQQAIGSIFVRGNLLM